MVAVALMKSNQDAVASLKVVVDPKGKGQQITLPTDRKVRLLALLETMPKKEECASSIRACELCRSEGCTNQRVC
jgi:hypothetical protein